MKLLVSLLLLASTPAFAAYNYRCRGIQTNPDKTEYAVSIRENAIRFRYGGDAWLFAKAEPSDNAIFRNWAQYGGGTGGLLKNRLAPTADSVKIFAQRVLLSGGKPLRNGRIGGDIDLQWRRNGVDIADISLHCWRAE